MQHEILNWDSEFLGITVARINKPDLSEHKLSDILYELMKDGVNLVYWLSNRKLEDNIIKQFNGNLVDKKTTFSINFRVQNIDNLLPSDRVKPYTSLMSINDVICLAIQSGEYSRFSVDQNIPRERFEALYNRWIQRSINKEIAEEVLVIQNNNRIAGVITLGNKNGRADIGLLAVDKNHRGKKYGEMLICAAQHWFVKKGYEFGQVETQGTNIPACNIYKKQGYTIEKEEYFYHFWLQKIPNE